MKEIELNSMNMENIGPLPMMEDSVRGMIEAILENQEGTQEEMYEYLI